MPERDLQSPTKHLDVRAFARTKGEVGGTVALTAFARVAAECVDGGANAEVTWSARGQTRGGEGSLSAPWLQLHVQAVLPLICQRCLEPVDTPVEVDQLFRFVPDEATAEQHDDAAVEDLLVESPDFDLHELVGDELLLAMPLIARHERCPTPPRLSAQTDGFDATAEVKPPAFAALGRLRSGSGESGE
ncbi:MAG: DUF177 domain-containing protein [Burkholderiaceae bacterium]